MREVLVQLSKAIFQFLLVAAPRGKLSTPSIRSDLSAPRRDPLTSGATLWYYHIVEFIESRPFTRRLHQLAGESADELLRAIQGELETKPDRGAMVPGLGGVRKARIANPGRGKGKRGGYLPLPVSARQAAHSLADLLDKNEQEDASEEQRKQMREWVALIKKSAGG